MNDTLLVQLQRLPGLLGQHVQLSVVALSAGIALSLPLALLLSRSPKVSGIALALCGVVQTIPGLALLALMVPLLGAFGFWPALLALTLYSLLPMLRNTVTGLLGVDEAVCEAAVGLGMTARQVLFEVRLPLAAPVVIAGIRTASVWVVGMGTLSTPVGQASLGNYIFSGLQTRNWTAVLVGCAASAVLAMAIDGLLALLQAGVTERKQSRLWGAGVGLGAVVGTALLPVLTSSTLATGGVTPSAEGRDGAEQSVEATAAPGAGPQRLPADLPPVRIGSKTFTEQYVLAALLERRLNQAGLESERIESLGSSVAFDALVNGDIDVYVDYTGTLWANHMNQAESAPSWKVLSAVAGWLAQKHSVRLLGKLGFENSYAIAMREERAAALGDLQTIADLAPHAKTLSLGSDYEFFDRPEWHTLKSTYELEFAELRSFDSSFMYAAVRDGEVDAITAFTSDGRIDTYGLTVLTDIDGAFPPYDAVMLLGPKVARRKPVVGALQPLAGRVTVELMRRANALVDDKDSSLTPAQAARWLDEQLARASGDPVAQ